MICVFTTVKFAKNDRKKLEKLVNEIIPEGFWFFLGLSLKETKCKSEFYRELFAPCMGDSFYTKISTFMFKFNMFNHLK